MLLKERTLDEAPRPPKKAMDYSSSSEEVESSEDDEEEGDGEPAEGSRDTPGGRYGAARGKERRARGASVLSLSCRMCRTAGAASEG